MKQLNNALIFGINYGGSVWRGKEGSLYAEYPLCKPVVYLEKNKGKFEKAIMNDSITDGVKTYTKPASW